MALQDDSWESYHMGRRLSSVPPHHSTWDSTDTCGTFSSAFAPHDSARVQISDIHTGALRPIPGGPLGPADRNFAISLFVVVRTGQTTF